MGAMLPLCSSDCGRVAGRIFMATARLINMATVEEEGAFYLERILINLEHLLLYITGEDVWEEFLIFFMWSFIAEENIFIFSC